MQLVLYMIFFCMIAVAAGLAESLKTGIVYSKTNAFILAAPDGWILDNESGASKGMHAVFYPEESTWEKSPVVMYAQIVKKKGGLRSIRDEVRHTVRDFQESGSPNIKVRRVKTVKAEKNKKGTVYYFKGDRWGNYEAVAYFEEKKSINSIVLHCSNEKDFRVSIKSFEDLVKSYKPLSLKR